MKTFSKLSAMLLAAGCTTHLSAATIAIGAGTYTQNFDSMQATGSTEPAPGWALRLNATATTMGTVTSLANAPSWGDTGGAFRNVSAANIPSGSDLTTQNANGDRALGFRQVRTGGYNPGMSLCFNFSTEDVQINGFSMDLLQLADVAARSSTFEIQYGLGSDPTAFTTLGSWTTDGIFGVTHLSFDRSNFGSGLDDESQVWLRIVALNAATGSGATFDLVAADNFSITASTVPEPSAALLAAVGLLAFFRRRR